MILDTKLPIRYLLYIVKYELITVLIVGIITHFGTIKLSGFLPNMPLTIPAFLGTSISVLLSFKMNQSYDRWWEARKIWGAITNDSRSLVIQLLALLEVDQAHIIKKIAYLQIAWCYSLGNVLRGNINTTEKLERLLDKTDLVKISTQSNHTLALLQLKTTYIQELRLNNKIDIHAQILLQETITRLTDSMGSVERISKTVFPSTYRLVLHFMIYIFVITLAVSLAGTNIVFVLPLLLLISAGFFMIEKIAYHLQDPFKNRPSDVPVTDISKTIEANIRQLLGEEKGQDQVQPNNYFVM